MTKYYQRELANLSDVYSAALRFDISDITPVIETSIQLPLVAVGSGGSFSTASFAADLHQRRTGQVSHAATPFESISCDEKQNRATICFSASGRNRDIGVAFKLAAQQEAGPVSALVLSDNTPLHHLQRRYAYTDVVGGKDPTFRDGFLAVATLLASSILLTRTYNEVLGSREVFPADFDAFMESSLAGLRLADLSARCEAALARDVTSLLFSPSARSAAVDLESRFVEAALGSLHIADFRNFGHGRHHWMAKRASETGVLAFVSDSDRKLADRTLDLLPDDVPVARVDLDGPSDFQSIAALVAGLHVSEGAGRLSGIDPGKPGVPSFGRKLYGLGPGARGLKTSEANKRAAIKRKAPDALRDDAQFDVWAAAYHRTIERFDKAKFGGVVFDYDGTICDNRARFDPLPSSVGKALAGLLDHGVKLGVATGRGASAGEALRQCLPQHFWNDVTIGYYNGAKITPLSDDEDDLLGPFEAPELVEALHAHPVLTRAEVRSNAAQISIRLPAYIGVASAISAVDTVLAAHGMTAKISASSHSIDVQFTAASKSDVVDSVAAFLPPGAQVLRIGDKGVWPGNDADLLASPFGLSVDEASRHLDYCWALAPAGVKGVQATLYYLSKLDVCDGLGGLRVMPGDRGDIYAT